MSILIRASIPDYYTISYHIKSYHIIEVRLNMKYQKLTLKLLCKESESVLVICILGSENLLYFKGRKFCE